MANDGWLSPDDEEVVAAAAAEATVADEDLGEIVGTGMEAIGMAEFVMVAGICTGTVCPVGSWRYTCIVYWVDEIMFGDKLKIKR